MSVSECLASIDKHNKSLNAFISTNPAAAGTPIGIKDNIVTTELPTTCGSRILGKSLCALGDFAVYPVQSYMRKYPDEFRAHVDRGGCPFNGQSSIEGIMAPSDQHAHAAAAEVPA